MGNFFSRLSYSFGNEDPKTESRALRLQPQDHVLCITASGDRPLNLLINPCKKITCVDANPIQNYLLNLKIAAMQKLSYSEYLGFLGLLPSQNRYQTLQHLCTFLKPEEAQYWLQHRKMIEKGVIYQGTVERLTKIAAKCLKFLRRRKMKRLLAIKNVSDQKAFIENEWDTYPWRKTFDIALNPLVSRFIITDPGLVNIGTKIQASSYIYDRFNNGLKRQLIHHSILVSLLFKGTVSSDGFPPYLTSTTIPRIRNRLNSIETQTANVVDYLESVSEPTFDVFSLSDVASYLSKDDFHRLLKAMIKTARPNARFCIRQFLSNHSIPTELQPFFQRNNALEQELEESDNCFIYRFFTGTIDK